ncbi:MAG TPA: pyridoxal-phosphate dependent enzyme [Planctomycetota bacterium]|nr:pyridoxal-phosphate dependent enzyme [Planctomycetota bacterium]
MKPLEPIALDAILAARERLAGSVLRTPLVPLELEGAPCELHLKLENLQPIGSFKLRGALNAIAGAPPEALERGVYTASAGNMAQGVAWTARHLGLRCRVIVPEQAPRAKLDAIERFGGELLAVPYERWWQVLVEHGYPGMDGLFVHPVSDPAVIAGNATIGLEILEDRPDVEAILVPYGGGGLSCGIASAVRALRPGVKVFACEVETAAPLAAALRAGSPQPIEHRPSFVDGIGGKGLLAEMWPLASRLLDGSIVVSLEQIAEAIRLLSARSRVVAEGAGAASLAAALTGRAEAKRVACVISGGNIDAAKLARILVGGLP